MRLTDSRQWDDRSTVNPNDHAIGSCGQLDPAVMHRPWNATRNQPASVELEQPMGEWRTHDNIQRAFSMERPGSR